MWKDNRLSLAEVHLWGMDEPIFHCHACKREPHNILTISVPNPAEEFSINGK